MKNPKPEFKRQESWRYKRVTWNWRRPRGVTSKMRKEESGFPAKVKIGYGSTSALRGLHPRGLVERLVMRELDIETLDPKIHIIRVSGRVGERKRIAIIAKAKEYNFHIANPGKEESRPVTEGTASESRAASVDEETATVGEGLDVEASEKEDGQSDTAGDLE